jgi:hypothetical protein
MKRTLILLAASMAVILGLSACTLSLAGKPTPLPTQIILLATPTAPPTVLPTPDLSILTPAQSQPTTAPGPAASTAIPGAVAATGAPGVIMPGIPSGPYAVIQVAKGETLNVRSAAGTSASSIATYSSTSTNVMRTGPSSNVNNALWVQVVGPGGGTGWVNSAYLTEYVAPDTFCADGRVNSLLTNFGNAVRSSSGGTLSQLVSPLHGMTVRLWRNGNAVVFDQAHAQWIFSSTYAHDWGAAPGSGLATVGSIHAEVVPKWMDVFTGNYTLSCKSPQTGGASYDTSWPAIYANVNFYSLYKPGPAGNENSWRTLLVGVEYVQNQPYLFSVTQLQWEP